MPVPKSAIPAAILAACALAIPAGASALSGSESAEGASEQVSQPAAEERPAAGPDARSGDDRPCPEKGGADPQEESQQQGDQSQQTEPSDV